MAKKSMILKQQKPQKFSTREYNRWQDLRSSARVPQKVRNLPYLLP